MPRVAAEIPPEYEAALVVLAGKGSTKAAMVRMGLRFYFQQAVHYGKLRPEAWDILDLGPPAEQVKAPEPILEGTCEEI
jgi:hypothetical protein